MRAGIAPGAVELGKEALPRVRLTGGLTRVRIRRPTRDAGPTGRRQGRAGEEAHAAQSGLGLQGLADRLPEGRRRLR